jgi:hypothetical protein
MSATLQQKAVKPLSAQEDERRFLERVHAHIRDGKPDKIERAKTEIERRLRKSKNQ